MRRGALDPRPCCIMYIFFKVCFFNFKAKGLILSPVLWGTGWFSAGLGPGLWGGGRT